MTVIRKFALYLAERSRLWMPLAQQDWGAAMRGELDYVTSDREALRWAFGCLRTSLAARAAAVHLPNNLAIRSLIVLPLLALIFADLFPTAMTAAYRLELLGLTREFGRATPGDDYARLIPLMEGIPLWLHALTTAAAALYAVTILSLFFRARASAIPVVFALLLEIAAKVLGDPVIDSIGVRANPNPPLLLTATPWLALGVLTVYLWKMRPAAAR